MAEALFALVSDWGAAALALATFLSCLAVPVPTSLMMLAAGAFVASGDLALAPVVAAAFLGALLGDQAGFGLGRGAGALLTGRLRRRPARARLLAQAEAMVAARGAVSVFFSRWLFSPLGPYVNLLAGGAGMGWTLFTAMSAAGEAVWVVVYVGLGFAFAGQLEAVAGLLADSVGLLTSALLATLAGYALLRQGRRRRLRR
jgi:membrane protein DedA with SNARE-associated domain